MAKAKKVKVVWPQYGWAYMCMGKARGVGFQKVELINRFGRPLKWLQEEVIKVEIRPARKAKRC